MLEIVSMAVETYSVLGCSVGFVSRVMMGLSIGVIGGATRGNYCPRACVVYHLKCLQGLTPYSEVDRN